MNNELYVRIFNYLPISDKAAVGAASRSFYILSIEAQREPQSVTFNARNLEELSEQMAQRLLSPPTFVLLLISSSMFGQNAIAMEKFLRTRIPITCSALCATTTAFGWGHDPNARNITLHNLEAYDHNREQCMLLLSCFCLPDALAIAWSEDRPSVIPTPEQLPDVGAFFVLMNSQNLNLGHDLGCLLDVLGSHFPHADVIGGVVEDQILCKNKMETSIAPCAYLAISPKVAFALSSRGVVPISDDVEVAEYESREGPTASIPNHFVTHLRTTPAGSYNRLALDVYAEVYNHLQIQCAPTYFGLRAQRAREEGPGVGEDDQGYEMIPVDPQIMMAENAMRVHTEPRRGDRGKFFQLRRAASVEDVERKMSKLTEAAEKLGDSIVGCLMVSCVSRTEHMMQTRTRDAELFHMACPDVHFVGMFSPSQIGPPPLAESERVFNTGKAKSHHHCCCMLIFIVNAITDWSTEFRMLEHGELTPAETVKIVLRKRALL